MRSGRRIEIHNGPTDDSNYQLFWQRLAIDKTLAGYEGKIDFDKISHYQGYDWNALHQKYKIRQKAVARAFYADDRFLLNRSSINQLFGSYAMDGFHKHIYQQQGLLKQAKSLCLLVTENLNKHQWAEIFNAVEEGAELDIVVSPGVTLPQEIMEAKRLHANQALPKNDPFLPQKSSSFIYSSDSDVTISQLKQNNRRAIVINISELGAADVVMKWEWERVKDGDSPFMFNEKKQFLLRALQQEEDPYFILKGEFSQELLNALLPLVKQYPGRLKLVTENSQTFEPFTPQVHEVTFEEKCDMFNIKQKEREKRAEKRAEKSTIGLDSYDGDITSLCAVKLDALLRYQKTHPDNKDTDKPWQGFYAIKENFLPVTKCDFNTAKEKTEHFFQQRLDLVITALNGFPYVFVGGLTGVGKSTFMETYFKGHIKADLYIGKDKLAQWADNPAGGYLFIDEANITHRDWSEFEGLFDNDPPTIIIDGELKILTPEHKVIFAGNPLNYGGSRHQPKLFERHGNSVVFSPLPNYVIYEEILKPIFDNIDFSDENKALLSQQLLKAYDLLVSFSDNEVLVTPRQLKSIAMLTIAECGKYPDKDLNRVFNYYALSILRPLLSGSNLQKFDSVFPQSAQNGSDLNEKQFLDGFEITESRKEAVKLLNAFLTLREYKRRNEYRLNDVQKFGDLASVVLESMPGQGKTEMLKALMKSAEIAAGDIHSLEEQENVYYYIPASLSLDMKERILRKAFDEGNIVIMDELNSSPMLEQLVNALLSGQTPEGGKPKRPGFLLLGTQNPVSMDNRIAQTHAQSKRVLKLTLSDYPKQEMRQVISDNKGLSGIQKIALVEAFQRQQDFAKREKLTPPNFRDLLRVAGDEACQYGKAEEEASSFDQLQVGLFSNKEVEKEEKEPLLLDPDSSISDTDTESRYCCWSWGR